MNPAMNPKKTARSVLAGLAFFFAASTVFATEFKLPTPEKETLPNGLQIVWFVSDKLPVVDLDFVFRSGSRDDLKGKSGTAELVSATLDRGAGGLTQREIAKQIESLGASRGASADDDFFHVRMHGLALDSDVLLGLMSRIVLKPDFSADEVKHEQARMLDGWSRLSDYGDNLVDLAYRRALTQGTMYARGGLLSSREFAKLKREDLIAFHKRHFTPKNAVLMVVGRVDKNAFRARIESLFGAWTGEVPRRESRTYSSLGFTPGSSEILLIDRPSLTQAQVRIGFKAPSIQDQRHYPLTVANALLGEYFHSRLNTLIRDKLGLTYGIGSSFSYNRNLATFSIGAATRNEATGQLIKRTLGVLRGLKSGPVPAEEVQTAKEYLIGGFPLSTATLEGVAASWLNCDLFDLGPDRLNEFVPRIGAVTEDQVVSAVSSAFDLNHLVIAVAGDAKAIEPVLKKEGYKVRRVSSASLIDGKN